MISEIIAAYLVIGTCVIRKNFNGLKDKPVFPNGMLAIAYVLTSAIVWPKFFFRKRI